MALKYRWDPCVSHCGTEVDSFVDEYFGQPDRNVLFIGGAGFDPRSTAVGAKLATTCFAVRAILFREIRPRSEEELIKRADANIDALTAAMVNHSLIPVNIFETDGAVVGGRNIVNLLAQQDFKGITDVIVDTSALSVGTSFPLIRYLVERIEVGKGPYNLHLFVSHDPKLDAAIQSVPSDAPGYVHGFQGGSKLDSYALAAKLWLPQIATGCKSALDRLHGFVEPHDTCPILPFPASDPRLGDKLAEEFLTELESGWSVDTRNIVYADEGNPLDLYRTILRLDDLRKPVFKEVGGSLLVLSPLGSKIMALGALMVALERDLPVAYLESIGYNLDSSTPAISSKSNLVHIWLEGDVYLQPRPALHSVRTGVL